VTTGFTPCQDAEAFFLDPVDPVAMMSSILQIMEEPNVQSAVDTLRVAGQRPLANRIKRLSKSRNALSHPDVGLMDAVRKFIDDSREVQDEVDSQGSFAMTYDVEALFPGRNLGVEIDPIPADYMEALYSEFNVCEDYDQEACNLQMNRMDDMHIPVVSHFPGFMVPYQHDDGKVKGKGRGSKPQVMPKRPKKPEQSTVVSTPPFDVINLQPDQEFKDPTKEDFSSVQVSFTPAQPPPPMGSMGDRDEYSPISVSNLLAGDHVTDENAFRFFLFRSMGLELGDFNNAHFDFAKGITDTIPKVGPR